MFNLDRSDIEDILSDFYLKIWEHIEDLPSDIEGVKKFLWTIFKNNFKDWFKKKDFIYF
jgi:DNA-directed RNA polymerase specialized sigma24 family protein